MTRIERRAFLAYTEKLLNYPGFNEAEIIALMKFLVKKLIGLHSDPQRNLGDGKTEEDFMFWIVGMLSSETVHKSNWEVIEGFKKRSEKPFPKALEAFFGTLDRLNWSNIPSM